MYLNSILSTRQMKKNIDNLAKSSWVMMMRQAQMEVALDLILMTQAPMMRRVRVKLHKLLTTQKLI